MQMIDVVQRLLAQQTRIFEILGFDERPLARPAATAEQLSLFGQWCRSRGFSLPPTYREFLSICNGIDNFCLSYGLFGTEDLASEAYPVLLRTCLADWIGFDYGKELPPILIGYDDETTTRVWFELAHERETSEEPIVLDGNPGDMSLHVSFGAFMESRIATNEATIARLLTLKAKASGDS